MTIEELRYLLEAGKSGSFSAAAEKLNISPQGLSQGIRHLEQNLNVRLFQRTSTGVALSEIGVQIYDHANNIFESLNKIEESIDIHRKNRIQKLHCVVKASRIGNQVKKHLEEFQKEYGVHIVTIDYHDTKQIGKIVSGHKADVIFEFKEIMKSKDANLTKQTLFKSFIQPIVNEENPLATKETVCWEDLIDINLIAETETHLYVPLLKNRLKEYGIKYSIDYCFDAPYCLEIISKRPKSVFFTTEYIFSQLLYGNSNLKNLKCCSMKEPLYLEYAAYIKNELAQDSTCFELVSFMQEKMKDYSTFKRHE